MLVEIKGPWRYSEEEARADRETFKAKFNLEHSHGIEGVRLTDHMEWRANCNVELDNISLS